MPDYIIEKEPLVNKFISVPKDKGNVLSVQCIRFLLDLEDGILFITYMH